MSKRVFTKEHLDKLKLSHIGKNKEKSSNWKGGLPKCVDCGKELSSYVAKRCKLCYSKSDDFRNSCRIRAIGIKQSKETIKKRVLKNTGRKRTEEQRLRIALSQKGEKGYWWQGGKSKDEYAVNWTKTLRRSIRERDHYTCRICGEQQTDRAFPVHHIDYDKKNCDPNNLITLCNSCHTKTNFNREYWIDKLEAAS